ncbi:putative sulfate exporter family transporter [Streptomyces sp. LP05-1]|uniref:Sulfate exporter family transporter n=1 Tax=Streptomyces pyxinae TaxID=2970734 RepID=A0ABT2CEL1_9ACTN|nr:putative sulfate exporter family transporter [Streptomyces sp. LP05-1]MCS0635840.1 putative sulfate exporter family transporter [Streptomyces sp. LP05-1]
MALTGSGARPLPGSPTQTRSGFPARARPGAGARTSWGLGSGAGPGLALAAAGVATAWLVHRALPAVPLLTAAVLLGVAAVHVPGLRERVRGVCRPGLSLAAKRLMRVGVVLLGLKLSLGDVLGLGWGTAVMVPAVVVATLAGTWWLGRRLGLPGDQPLLIASGYAICGASAIGAVSAVRDSDEDDAAASVALVTLCGTLAIAVLPLLHVPLGLDDAAFGRWVGASVHDVGQVVATAQTAGPTALGEAVLVKLVRVALLAPLVAGLALAARRRSAAGAGGEEGGVSGKRPPLVPLFVAGFLAMVALRTTGLLPAPLLTAAGTAQELLLAAALFGLGSAVHLPTLARTGTGVRVAALGLSAWVLVAAASYAGVLLTTG